MLFEHLLASNPNSVVLPDNIWVTTLVSTTYTLKILNIATGAVFKTIGTQTSANATAPYKTSTGQMFFHGGSNALVNMYSKTGDLIVSFNAQKGGSGNLGAVSFDEANQVIYTGLGTLSPVAGIRKYTASGTFISEFSANGADDVRLIVNHFADGYLYTNASTASFSNAYLQKRDLNGNILISYPTSSLRIINRFAEVPSGNLYVASNIDSLVQILNPTGSQVATFSVTGQTQSLVYSSMNNCLYIGEGSLQAGLFVRKRDLSGSIVWSYQVVAANNNSNATVAIIELSDGSLFIPYTTTAAAKPLRLASDGSVISNSIYAAESFVNAIKGDK